MSKQKYAALAKDYDIRWAHYNAATIKHTLARLEVCEKMSVLDVGCGTGNMLKTIADTHPGIKLSGIEPTQAMIDIAREKLGADVSLKQAIAEKIPYDDRSFDAILSNSMFHYIHKPESFLREAGRLLKPGGQLIITDWCYDFLTSKINNLTLRLKGDNYFRIYKIRELTALLSDNGFSQVTADRYKINWYWGLMTAEAKWPP